MKKFIALSILGLLIMAFSATAYAQPKLTFVASGYLEVVSVISKNLTPGTPAGFGGVSPGFIDTGNIATTWPTGYWPRAYGAAANAVYGRTSAYMEERARLNFSFIMDKSLSATVGFELDSGRWGSGNTYTGMGAWNTDTKEVEIMYAYITAGLPYIGIPIPMTVRAGIQPLAVRPSIFLYTDGPAVTGTLNIDPVLVGLTWAKAVEGRDATSDDVDVYGLTASAKIGTISVGGFAYYYNMNTYPLNQTSTSYGVTPPNEAAMWWLGFNSDGKIGPVNYNFDFVYDFGNVRRRQNATPAISPFAKRKVDYTGFATQLKVTFPWEKFAFGALGMYASGADLNKTSRWGYPGDTVASNTGAFTSKVGSYLIPPGSEEWAIWGEAMVFNNNYISGTALPPTMTPIGNYGAKMTRGAIGGTWVGKAFASVSPVPWYKVTLQGLYIGDTTKHGNTLNVCFKNGRIRDDKTIGWEFDLLNDIKIYNNLTWSVGGGILFAGDALDINDGTARGHTSPSNPWIIATKLRYDF